jgi:hypothetical protein
MARCPEIKFSLPILAQNRPRYVNEIKGVWGPRKTVVPFSIAARRRICFAGIISSHSRGQMPNNANSDRTVSVRFRTRGWDWTAVGAVEALYGLARARPLGHLAGQARKRIFFAGILEEIRAMKGQSGVAEPSRPLGIEGRRVWAEVLADYPIDNPAGGEILLLVCESVDRLVGLRGERSACSDEKALGRLDKDITAVTALIASLLAKLDKFVERRPRRGVGRPPVNIHWDGPHAVD